MLEEIFNVSQYPYLHQNQTFSQKLLSVLKTYGVVFLAMLFTAPLFLMADKFVVSSLHHQSLENLNKREFHHIYQKLGFLKSYLFVCLIGPAFEEIIFRLPLSFRRQHVAIALLIALFYFGGFFLHIKDPLIKLGIEGSFAILIIGICSLTTSLKIISISPANKKQWVVSSMILFGLMHIFNYMPVDYHLIWIYPVFVLPQLIMGWGLTYVRFKNGFAWGILMHSIINTIAVLFAFHR